MAFRPVAWCLLQTPKRNADLGWVVVVGADEVGAADLARVFDDELRGVMASEELLTFEPGELRCFGNKMVPRGFEPLLPT